MRDNPGSDFFSGNRARLRELFTGTAPIVITANGLLQRSGDSNYPFRQDSNFWYLTGISEPDIILVLDKEKEYLIVPTRGTSRAAFDGAIDNSELIKLSGIEVILDADAGWKQLGGRLGRVKHVATLAPSPSYIEDHGLYTNPARAHLIERIKKIKSDIELLDLRSHLTKMRMIKQPIEMELIQEAIDMTVKSLKKYAKKGWQSFDHEHEVEAALTADFLNSGARHAYQPIIASGKNACTLHYVQNRGKIEDGSLLLLDVGAEVSNYAADITRTYAVGKISKRQQQVYDAVLAVQDYALSLLKPGVLMRQYEEKVMHFMGEKLRELVLIKTIEPETVRQYYPHSTSHFLGLDVHDAADYDQPLEPGMVLTVEPGIYIPQEGIGVRIEDDVVIEAEGARMLSAKLPRVLS